MGGGGLDKSTTRFSGESGGGEQSSPSEYKGSSIKNRLPISCVGGIMGGIKRILESLGGGVGGVG